MPNIKISELTAPIAVSDADILPAVQSSVTRKITWGALKSTLAGALGRAYLGLGTASTANVTTSAIDTTAGRVLKAGDGGLLGLAVTTTSLDTAIASGYCHFTERAFGAGGSPPLGLDDTWEVLNIAGSNSNRAVQMAGALTFGRYALRARAGGVNSAWAETWTSLGANAITVDTGSFGYGVGSGGTVTQATSKSTAVTLNKPSGRITMSAESLVAGASPSFIVNNSKVNTADCVLVSPVGGTGASSYRVEVMSISSGSFIIRVTNISGSTVADALQINFVVIKGATA